MDSERTIIEIPMDELTLLDTYFKRHSGIDTASIPEKYGNSVMNNKKIIEDSMKIFAVYRYADISKLEDNLVTLATGDVFTGKIPPKVLKDSSKVFCFVASLKGYAEAEKNTSDFMEKFFLDAWGTVYIENAAQWLKDKVRNDLALEHLNMTHAWSPGQYQFDLVNQRALFQLLKPEDIGCSLAESCKMNPIKTVSGIMGVIPEEVINTLLPCDFCKLKETCPVSKSGICHSN